MAERYILELTDKSRKKFLEELLAQLDFVRVEKAAKPTRLKKTPMEQELQDNLREALLEVKDDLSGKKKLRSARAFLDELRG